MLMIYCIYSRYNAQRNDSRRKILYRIERHAILFLSSETYVIKTEILAIREQKK